jgi:hypothetical protein
MVNAGMLLGDQDFVLRVGEGEGGAGGVFRCCGVL